MHILFTARIVCLLLRTVWKSVALRSWKDISHSYNSCVSHAADSLTLPLDKRPMKRFVQNFCTLSDLLSKEHRIFNVAVVLSLAPPNSIVADQLSNWNRLEMSAWFVISGLLPLVVNSALGIIRFLHLFWQFQLEDIKALFCFVVENIQLLLSRLWEKLFYLGFTDSIRALLVSFIYIFFSLYIYYHIDTRIIIVFAEVHAMNE